MLAILVGGVALALAGCGGGGGSTTTPPVGPVPTAAPSANIPVGPSPATAVISGGGYTLTFTVPAISGGTTATISAALTTTVPTGVPTPSSVSRGPASSTRTPSTVGVPLTNLVYLTVKSSATLTLGSVPSFTYTLPAGVTVPSGSTAYVLLYDPSQSATGWLPVLGPGVVSGQNVTFAGVSSTFTLTAGLQYVYALVLANQVLPSPIPSPGALPTPGICPLPASPGLFPMAIQNNTGASGPIEVWVAGLNTASSGYIYLTSPTSGVTASIPAAGTAIPGFSLPSDGCIDLPPMVSARVLLALGGGALDVISNGPTLTGGVAYPAPWNASPSDNISTISDFLEYTWTSTPASFNLDTTQVDAIGIPITFQAVNATGSPAASPIFGMKPYAISNLEADLQILGAPWTGLIQQTGTSGISRVISPQHAVNIPADGAGPPPTPAPNQPVFSTTNYWDAAIAQIWKAYQGSNFLALSYPQFPSPAYGLVDPTTNTMNFYSMPSTSATLLGSVPYPTTWDVFNNAGAFAANATGPDGIYLGRALVVSIERGMLPLPAGAPTGPQPFCGLTDWQYFYGGAATNDGTTPVASVVTNWYSALMHKYGEAAVAGLPGLAYAFPDDDECQNAATGNGLYDPDFSQPYSAGEQWSVTLNPF
ncbi:MAG: beta-1,3-glucanase family protein [Candidatus Baltobacteraceae bacterium]